MRYSDQPITRPGDDALGRASFALELARSIDNLSVARDGFVMALVGEWGSGKTSVIELVVRYLKHIEMERASTRVLLGDEVAAPKTLDQLEQLGVVFDTVKSKIEAIEELNLDTTRWQREHRWSLFRSWLGSDGDADAADLYWRLKLRAESNPRTVVIRFSPWLIAGKAELATALLSELARALGAPLGDDVKRAFASMITRLSEFLPIAGASYDLATGHGIGRLMSIGGEWSRKVVTTMTSGPTLEELRINLKNALRRLPRQQALVIVDDVDRLTPLEALEMISLVKSVGDLPNVVYLLSYEEAKLTELIRNAINVDGHSYLEKIVQYAIALPPIEDDDLTRLLDADLEPILGNLSPDEQRRLGLAWHFTLRHYIRTPRDVRRFVNAIAVARSALADYTDSIDLINLQAMQLFEPDIYWWLRRNLNDFLE